MIPFNSCQDFFLSIHSISKLCCCWRVRCLNPPHAGICSHTYTLPLSPCPSFPRQSSLKAALVWRRARQVVVVMQRGDGRRPPWLHSCLHPRSLLAAPPLPLCTRGWFWSGKIKSRLHCTWVPRASYVGFIYTHIHFYVPELRVASKDIWYCGMGLVPPSLVKMAL